MSFQLSNINFSNLSQSTGFGSGGQMTFGQTQTGQFASAASSIIKGGKSSGYDSGGLGMAMSGLKMIPVYGQALALVEGIIGKGAINKTLGALFANGFKFQCWGASWTPSRADRELPAATAEVTAAAKKALNVTPDVVASSINNFVVWFYTHDKSATNWKTQRSWLRSSAKDCTKKGLEKFFAGMDKTLDESIRAYKAAIEEVGGKLHENGTKKVVLEPHKNTSVNAKQYRVEWLPVKSGGTTVTGEKRTISDIQTGNTVKTAGSGLLMGGLVLGGLYLAMKKRRK